MSLFVFIVIILLSSISDARLRKTRFESHRQRGGQMGFKWSRKHHTKPMNVENKKVLMENKNEYTSTTSIPYGLGINGDEYEPTLNPEISGIPSPEIVIDNTEELEIDDNILAFTTMDSGDDIIEHQAPIMDCLYDKCHDQFINCFDNEECKEFMRTWQQKQSLNDECIPSINGDVISQEPMVTDEPMIKCEYGELFWNTYHCGVDSYCYNDELILITSRQYLQSPSNYRVSPTNITGSKSSSFDFTLLMVAITSGISAVILVEVLRRLYNGFKNKCSGNCECNGCLNSFRYLQNKWDQLRGYQYEKTHDDLTAIEESDDDEIYGNKDLNDLQTGNGQIGVTYNGIINDDSSDSDDEELQKCSSIQKDVDIHTDHNDEQSKQKSDEQKDTEEIIEESQYLSTPTQQL